MIKFFRNIRKSLVMENNTSKYIKYAIGEIFLVVVGILIALWINNLNEENNKRIKEKAILEELHKDFLYNLKDFKEVKRLHYYSLKNTILFKKYINHPNPILVKDSIAKYYFSAFNSAAFNPSNGVVESLISSGEYQLIRNDTLRKYIISWKDVVSNYSYNESFTGNLWSQKIEPFLINEGDLTTLNNPKNLELITSQKFKNLTERHLLYINNLVNHIKTGVIEEYIEGITRLSKTN